jgi:uncharacterized protein (DUF1800 family)
MPLPTYTPSTQNPWDERKAAHLLNRAGFGGPPDEIAALTRLGYEKAVARLLNYDAIPDYYPTPDWVLSPPEELAFPDKVGVKDAALPARERQEKGYRTQAVRSELGNKFKLWWLKRLCITARPFQEKMTLFWHGHLVSSLGDGMNPYWLFRQVDLYRRLATGNFKTLALEVSKDACMLRYLDNDRNKRKHPNENYARELMELFTMGIGNYTEDDIKQSARAFSGWSRRDSEFQFSPFEHDYDEKTFLGRTGKFDGADIVNIIFEQPCVARFIATKLWKFFINEEPEPEAIDQLAQTFRDGKYELKPLLRAIFTSETFYSEKAIRAQIKSPIQLAVNAIRTLKIENPNIPPLVGLLRQMGQDILNPPNVKGWDGGPLWMNTTTLLARYNFAKFILNDGALVDAESARARSYPPKLDHLLAGAQTAEESVDRLTATLLGEKLSGEKRAVLVNVLHSGGQTFDPSTPEATSKLRSLAYLIASTPNFQLC